MKFVKSLKCTKCGDEYPPLPDKYLCPQCKEEGLLDVRYNYQEIRRHWSKEQLSRNDDFSIWRYLPLLPVKSDTTRPPLRVGWTPLYESSVLGKKLGLKSILIKDDGLNPTGSLKDRASAIATVKAQEADNSIICCSSTGNAASSLAGNVASLSQILTSVIFVPESAPQGKITQLLIYGAKVVLVRGSYEDSYQLSDRMIDEYGWYNRNAAINPYLIEGKKTSALELAEALNWQLPDWIVFTVGDGCTIAGAWKGLYDLYNIGFIEKIPRLLGVQSELCAPITGLFKRGKPLINNDQDSLADSIAVKEPRNALKAVNAIKDSMGDMVNVSDQEMLSMMDVLGNTMGIFGELSGVAGLAGVKKMVASGRIQETEKVAVVITGNGLKDKENASIAAPKPLVVKPELESAKEQLIRKLDLNNIKPKRG